MYHLSEGTRPCPFPVTENGHGRVTDPQGDHFSGRNLGVIPYIQNGVIFYEAIKCQVRTKFWYMHRYFGYVYKSIHVHAGGIGYIALLAHYFKSSA